MERNPGLVPSLAAVSLVLWFAADKGGFAATTWMPATLLLGAVLVTCLAVLPRPRPARAALAAVLLLAGYGLFSLLSMLWADQPELAWDAGNRTLLYTLILALCALWPLRGRSAAVVLGVFGLGVAAIALIELVKTSGADQASQFFDEGRLAEPLGYINANVGMWMLGLLPCAVLAGRRGVPGPLRGLFGGAAGILAGAAVLGQSRGWLMVLPVVATLAILVVPGRGRTIAALAAVGAAIAVVLGPLLDVYSGLRPHGPPGAVFDSALRALLLASAGLAILGALAAVLDERVQVPAARARRISAAVVAAAALAAVGVVAGYAVVERSPFTAASDAWHEVKRGGYSPTDPSGRLTAGLSTYRYDYWRVAWSEFEDAPLLGAGADNFGREYLRRGDSPQRPQFPHSTELVALGETGLVGALLLAGALLCAVLAVLPGRRSADLAGAVSGAGLLMLGYWLAHGTVDRFWEFPALSGAALAGLGVGVAAAQGLGDDAGERRPFLAGPSALAVAVGCGLLLALSVVPPWLSERERAGAIDVAPTRPEAALDRLDRAAELNPLSPAPYRTAGLVELERGHHDAAVRQLRRAFERDSGDSDLHFLLGLAESESGRPNQAIGRLREALTLAPRDHVADAVLRELRRSGRLDPLRLDPWTRADYRDRLAID